MLQAGDCPIGFLLPGPGGGLCWVATAHMVIAGASDVGTVVAGVVLATVVRAAIGVVRLVCGC